MFKRIHNPIFKKACRHSAPPMQLNDTQNQCIHTKKAQHIMELSLLAPFVIILIGIIIEIAIVVHTNYKFNSALYEAISLTALTDKINTTKEESINDAKEYAKILLNQRLAPYSDTLDIKLVETGDLDFLIGTYKYTSTFTLLNIFKDFTLGAYNFSTIIPINSAVLRRNSFDIPDAFFTENIIEIAKPKDSNDSTENNTDESLPEDKNSETFDIEIPEANI